MPRRAVVWFRRDLRVTDHPHLLVDWREGARFFLQHLVDGDLPANNGGWQWVAGTGADAAPYYRIFNPVTQAERFDPDGDYIHRWVPELARLDPPAIFAPGGPAPPTFAPPASASAPTTPTRWSTTSPPATAPWPGSRRPVLAVRDRRSCPQLSPTRSNPVDRHRRFRLPAFSWPAILDLLR